MLKSFLRNKFIFCFFLTTAFFCSAETVVVCLGEYRYYPSKQAKRFKKLFPGEISIKKYKGKYLLLNHIDVEKYLYGVLSREMSSDWPFESLKAQAVISRTYFIWKSKENRENNLPYDIKNSIYHQVYGVCKNKIIKDAVNSTKGEILTYNGEVAKVFFHACCGGTTALPVDVWGGNYEGLCSVTDPYCEESPYYYWKKIFKKTYLSEVLGVSGIDKILIKTRDTTGRVKMLQLITKGGNIIEISGHKFRLLINEKVKKVYFKNPAVLPSTLFKIKENKDFVIFEGKGYGHGVGLCQWGARKMAEKGKNYKEILNFFLPLMKITSPIKEEKK